MKKYSFVCTDWYSIINEVIKLKKAAIIDSFLNLNGIQHNKMLITYKTV